MSETVACFLYKVLSTTNVVVYVPSKRSTLNVHLQDKIRIDDMHRARLVTIFNPVPATITLSGSYDNKTHTFSNCVLEEVTWPAALPLTKSKCKWGFF